jgi:CRISPR-associated protein Csx3
LLQLLSKYFLYKLKDLSISVASIQLDLISHNTQEGLPYQHLRIQLTSPDGIVDPQDLQGLKLPDSLQSSQGVVIEGKAPIWLYSYLVDKCHTTSWMGCYDPRLEGAVVVESYTEGVSVGSVLKLRLPN